MRTITLALVLGTLVLGTALTTGSAEAQDRNDESVTRFDFEDELVRGDLVRPDGEILHVRSRRGRTTLIRPRESFIAELYESVEHL
jgi:hypothetical protein